MSPSAYLSQRGKVVNILLEMAQSTHRHHALIAVSIDLGASAIMAGGKTTTLGK